MAGEDLQQTEFNLNFREIAGLIPNKAGNLTLVDKVKVEQNPKWDVPQKLPKAA